MIAYDVKMVDSFYEKKLFFKFCTTFTNFFNLKKAKMQIINTNMFHA